MSASPSECAKLAAQVVERDGPAAAIAALDSKVLAARLETQREAKRRADVDEGLLDAIRDELAERRAELADWHALNGEVVDTWNDGEPSSLERAYSAEPAVLELQPSAEEPLRGLHHLAKVAVTGSKALRDLANAPVLYIWEDIAIAGQIVVVAGKVGCGKTTLLFWTLSARMNTGDPICVLGREVTPAPPGAYVVLIEGEHGESSTARKLLRTCVAAGIVDVDAALDRVIVVARKSVRIGGPEWRDVCRMIAAGLVSDVALDTLARLAPGEANSEEEQIAIFAKVTEAIDGAPSEATKPVVWAAAHMRKGEEEDLDAVSGSAQRTGQADTVLFVKATRSDGKVMSTRVTFPKLREDPDDYPEPVEFTVTRTGISICGTPDKDERPIEERILERLKLFGPQTKTALSTAMGRSKPDLEEPLSNLFAARQIGTTDIQIRGQARKAFCVRDGA